MSAIVATEARTLSRETAPARGRIGFLPFVIILAELSLLLLVLRQFQIESGAFLRVAALAFAGFAVHAVLPLRYRLPFFVVVSLVAIGVALDVVNGLWLLGIGLSLIGICHLPVPFAVRGALLIGAGLLLAFARAGWLHAPWPEAIWPILGSMFMFRLMVYFYDLRHDTTPVSPWRTLAYFFMLPNACFPLFPVVDHKTFSRNSFDGDAFRIYQTGIDWMVRGVIHLILYRFVYYYTTLAPAEVKDSADLVQFLVSNFLLYLRVSGQFHLIVGMLYLFGFRLPETHHRYMLASSFTDFWRRINIYWKDFMLKLFYYPAFFKLRKLGTTQAMVLATLLVFLLTWFLHAYQWFWLRGSYLLVGQDVLFWTILGALVVVNSLYEAKHGRSRTLGKGAWSWRSVSIQSLKIAGTFCVIVVLWSFWTADSLAAWLSLWTAVGGRVTATPALGPGLVLAGVAVAGVGTGALASGGGAPSRGGGMEAWRRSAAFSIVELLILAAIGLEQVHARLLSSRVATIVHSLRSGRLSRLDEAKLHRGYYENLVQVDRFNSQLWEVYMKRPANWRPPKILDPGSGANITRFTGGFAQTELNPSFVASTDYGTLSTNRWGMRDQDYELKPAPGVHRAVMLGASSLMGWGVPDGATFEALVEDRLNREHSGPGHEKYEILNFGVPGYQPPQELPALERALTFSPDTVIYVATGREINRSAVYLHEVVQKRIEIPYDRLRAIVGEAGVLPGMDETVAVKRLEPFRREILSWIYQRVVDESRAKGAVPVLVFLPQVTAGAWKEETPETLEIAAAAGFVVIDMSDVYSGRDSTTLRLAEWDDHPNAEAHRLVAARLYDELQRRNDVVFKAAEHRPAS
jgi:hypothetical protein